MPDPVQNHAAPVLQELCQAIAAQSVALFLPDGDGGLVLAASDGRPGPASGPLARLRRASGAGVARSLIVPLPDPNGGVLVLERAGQDEFSRDDRALVRVYARQLATESVGMGGRTTWTRQLETIHRLGAQLNRLTRIEDVGTTMCAETRQVLDYDEARLFVSADHPQAPPLTLLAEDGAPVDRSGQPLSLPEDGAVADALRRCLANAAPLIVAELANPGPGRSGIWSLMAVPLRNESRTCGVLCLMASRPTAFDDDGLRLVRILADQAAVAVENARAVREREELVEELHALLEISRAASEAADETSLARSLAAKLRAASRTDACIISRWAHDSTMLTALAHHGVEGTATLTDIAEFPQTWAVLRSTEARVIQSDPAVDAEPEARALAALGGHTLLMLPLTVGGRAIGLIELISLSGPRYFGPDEMKVFQTMAGSAAAGLENVRLLEQLRHAADVDQVTGANNHRYLQERLRQEIARAARGRGELSVLMLDLDHFKPINDRFGHADGDRVLRNVANTIKNQVRTNDIVARYGGDEFVVVMPDTPSAQAQEVARRVIVGIRERRHELSDGSEVKVGCSGGLAVYPENGRTAALLLQAADGAMYASKRAGRGQLEPAAAGLADHGSGRETLLVQSPRPSPAAG